MTRLVLPLAAFAIAGLVLPRPAHACICPPITAEELVQVADIILTGTVTELTITPPLDPDAPDTLQHTSNVILQVDEYLKGSGPSTVTILEPGFTFHFDDNGEVVTGLSTCATFRPGSGGSRYLLFLQGEVDSLVSGGVCSGSHIVDEAYLLKVRAALAEPIDLPPSGSAPAGDQPHDGTPWLTIIVGSSLGLTLLVTGGWLTLRAWRRT